MTAHNITINSGVLFRKSVTIDFDRIQNVDNRRGPIQMMFGITSVNLWTASQGQMQVSRMRIGNTNQSVATPKPDGRLLLSTADAEELRQRIATETAVQKVQMVTATTTV